MLFILDWSCIEIQLLPEQPCVLLVFIQNKIPNEAKWQEIIKLFHTNCYIVKFTDLPIVSPISENI